MVFLVSILLFAALCFLLWRDHFRRPRRTERRARPRPVKRWETLAHDSRAKARPRRRRVEVLVDGSNVMHWQDNAPQLASLQLVVSELTAKGYTPGVIFDANAGYKLFGQYRDDFYMARCLGLPAEQVLVVPKGQPADRFLLELSRRRQAPIVTRDRYRDWAEAFPEVDEPGRLIQGGFREGRPWIDLDRVA